MTGLTVSGIVSGLDVNGIIDGLVAAERDPTNTRLDLRELEIDAELSAVGTLKSGLAAFRDAASPLAFATTFQSLNVQSSDSDVIGASASSVAEPGSYQIEASQLAQAHGLASKAFESTTESVGEGTITVRFGTYDADGNTFTANAEKTAQSFTIDSSNSSLQGLRDTINAADAGVEANIVNDGSGFRLVLRSEDTGAANSLQITVSGDTDGQDLDDAGLSQLAFDPTTAGVGTGKNLTETVAALDASFTVDGLDITKASNSVSDVIQGVTLSLSGTTTGSPVTLSLEQNTSQLRSSIDEFLSAYNDLTGLINELGGYDAEEQVGGILVGDSMLRTLQSQLRSTISDAGSGLTGSVRSMVDIGIRTSADGTLSVVDEAAFTAALADNAESVAGLFSAVGSNDDPLINFLTSTDASVPGSYAVNITQVATQGSYTGAATSSLTVDADNDTFRVNVDGVASGTITLTQATYANGDDLAAELQAQINADSVLAAGGARVGVSYESGQLLIRSERYGSESTVSISSVDTTTTATLGLGAAVGTSVAGLDVAGTIGGTAATGSGQILTGTGDAAGLAIEVLGGATGSRDTLNFARGFASSLLDTLDAYLDSDGILDDRSASLDAQTSDVEAERALLDERILTLEERLREEFTQLEIVLAQLQSTSEFLTQQLSALPSINNSG